MPQTPEGAGRSAWIQYMKQCALDYRSHKAAGTLSSAIEKPATSLGALAKPARRVTGKQSPLESSMAPPPPPPKRFKKLAAQAGAVELGE